MAIWFINCLFNFSWKLDTGVDNLVNDEMWNLRLNKFHILRL